MNRTNAEPESTTEADSVRAAVQRELLRIRTSRRQRRHLDVSTVTAIETVSQAMMNHLLHVLSDTNPTERSTVITLVRLHMTGDREARRLVLLLLLLKCDPSANPTGVEAVRDFLDAILADTEAVDALHALDEVLDSVTASQEDIASCAEIDAVPRLSEAEQDRSAIRRRHLLRDVKPANAPNVHAEAQPTLGHARQLAA